MVAGLREMARLMGFYAPSKARIALDRCTDGERIRMERMSDAQMLALVQRGGAWDADCVGTHLTGSKYRVDFWVQHSFFRGELIEDPF